MTYIPEITKAYSGVVMSFAKPRTSYVPHLDLFDKANTPGMNILANLDKSGENLLSLNGQSDASQNE